MPDALYIGCPVEFEGLKIKAHQFRSSEELDPKMGLDIQEIFFAETSLKEKKEVAKEVWSCQTMIQV